MAMVTYRDAGVDISAGEETVRRIKAHVRRTFSPNVLTDIGAFGGFYALDTNGIDEPVLVSSVDGVGTKLKVAIETRRYDTIGQDLVNHCVNDIAVCGARPLYFLDYYATGKLDPSTAEAIVSGFAEACVQNGCALIGGETAEMPGLYAGSDFDLAGMIVGIVDRTRIVNGQAIVEDDVLIGLPSTGLHTNGYSLARKVLLDAYDLVDAPAELAGETLADSLLAIHRTYLRPIQSILQSNLPIHGMAHITGGGIPGNIKRILPESVVDEIDYSSWGRPPIFKLIQKAGHIEEEEMRQAFNLGIGLILIVPRIQLKEIIDLLESVGEKPIMIGGIRSRE